MHYTLFPYFLAAMVRLLHLPVQWALLGTHLALLWLLIFALHQLSTHCWPSPAVQWAAVAIAAFCLATPVAGTALCIADPYLTPRSFATPLCLLLFAAVLDHRLGRAALLLELAVAFHPLMGIYAGLFALVLWTVDTQHIRSTLRVCLVAILGAGLLVLAQRHTVESPAYIHAALTRTYFYLAEWHWYEIFGLFAPLAIFLWIFRCDLPRFSTHARYRTALSGAAMACGITAITISCLLVHPASHSHLLARLQPLRTFHTLYVLMFLLLAGTLAERLLRRVPMRSAAVCVAALLFASGSSMFCVERQIFPDSAHFELPGRTPQNQWQQAFLWSREHTQPDALFALDANFITAPGEDGQSFRAMAERSSLSDYSKDGGSSAVFPQLAAQWQPDEQRSTNLSRIADSERISRLAAVGVSWIVLQQKFQTGLAQTHLACPYRNATVLVCRIP